MNSSTTIRRSRLLLLVVVTMLVAMAGSATAGGLITGKKIKNNSITGIDLKNGTVTGADVKNGSLTPDDFDGQLIGPQGPQGPQGEIGPIGPRGPAGASGLVYVNVENAIDGKKSENWGIECPDGKKVVGGGVSSNDPANARVVESAPLDFGAGWWVGLRNEKDSELLAYAWAVCVTG